jgi:hypothetical protein
MSGRMWRSQLVIVGFLDDILICPRCPAAD